MPNTRKNRLTAREYINGILNKDRVLLSRAITLVESRLPEDTHLSEKVVAKILPHTGRSKRIGITGVPGVGKSTFIESLGFYLCEKLDKKVAVLTVDPSSQKSGGSILGDKTRMETLSHHPNAYIRPSATGDSIGGVANKTREAILLCEAAGFDIILIETVGVGQSEIAVKGMVDFFLLLMLAGAGDELQGIKKGIMEMADAIAITKVDGDNIKAGQQAKAEYQNALHLFPAHENGWAPNVKLCSAMKNEGIEEIWKMIEAFFKKMNDSGALPQLRKNQNINWMHETILQVIKHQFYTNEKVQANINTLEEQVAQGMITPQGAARQLLSLK